ncbi:50S ribosomal protein L17 [Candidatus Tremblaya phenacola]|uniref:50S ribosomal protein L17 n=1 Tax=Candidatus Tremblayella phenacoccinincola TaxID=1010676 RepID=A0A2G0V6V3_9PROT|nr:50S ribosomal protein L17 [Candidatus Tremblaya phenacola]PHN16191.1 50S ribosomal protein L17 [Candidatus Tremblaya phenacola]
MKHSLSLKKLNRKTSHRLSLFKNLTHSLITRERIYICFVKAKSLRKVIEPIITHSKKKTVANIRTVMEQLNNESCVRKVFNILGPRYLQTKGGYIHIIKSHIRKGDKAVVSMVELI